MNREPLDTQSIRKRIQAEAASRRALHPGETTAPIIEPYGVPPASPEAGDPKENRTSGVRKWVQQSYNIPVAGYFIRMVTAVLNLPVIMRNLSAHQAATETRLSGKADREDLETLQYDLMGKADLRAFAALSQQVKDHRLHITDLQRRMLLLLESVKGRLPEPVSREQMETMIREEDHILDAMYMVFEDRFRGTRTEIKRRLEVYLPLIDAMKQGKATVSILDVGCGRGEWLELLREKGCSARGIDINRMALQQCREYGLDVAEADVLAYLQGLTRGSLDVITGFHIAEHLPFRTLVAMLDEVLAVLRPGGLIVLETPNPANILVSAYDFYRDPGHTRPLHPDTLHFLAESRGFLGSAACYFVSQEGPQPTLIPSGEWPLNDINDYIRAPRDFALIAHKP